MRSPSGGAPQPRQLLHGDCATIRLVAFASKDGDRPRQQVLDALHVAPGDLLGEGGEASVYALGGDRVARVHRAGYERVDVESRTALLSELGASADLVPFAIPSVLETRVVDGHIVTIEPRLPGRSLRDVLQEITGAAREALLRSYLDAAAAISLLRVERPFYGDLCRRDPVRARSFRSYLEARAAESLRRAGPRFERVDAAALARALPEPTEASFVHLDAFPGNMLSDGSAITAVLDFGVVALLGDRRLDPLSAAVYLQPPMTRDATRADRAVARAWLASRGLARHYDATERWIAAFWSAAPPDTALHAWCRSVLLERSSS